METRGLRLPTDASGVKEEQNIDILHIPCDRLRAFLKKSLVILIFGIYGRSFSNVPDSRAGEGAPQKIDHAVIGGVVAVVMFAILCALIVLGRYFARHKGKTPEVQSHSIMTRSVVLFRVECSRTEVCSGIKGRRAPNLSPLHCSCSRHLLHA